MLLNNFDKVKYSVFFDLYENSMMDILIVKAANTHKNVNSEITAIYNNFAKDIYFLKTRLISDDTLGTTLHSASFRCVLTDLDDDKFVVSAAQSG